MKFSILLILSLLGTSSASASTVVFKPNLIGSIEAVTQRNEVDEFSAIGLEYSFETFPLHYKFISLGATTSSEATFEKEKHPIGDWKNIGPKITMSLGIIDNLDLQIDYSYQFITDQTLQEQGLVENRHVSFIELNYSYSPKWQFSFNSEYTYYNGRIPLYVNSPLDSLTVGALVAYNWGENQLGISNEWIKEQQYHYPNKKTRDEYFYINTFWSRSFGHLDAEIKLIFEPSPRSHYGPIAKNTFRTFNFGFGLTYTLE